MSWPPLISHAALLYRTFWFATWPIWMILFAMYFPERADIDVRRPRLKWILLTPVTVLCAVYVLIRILNNENIPLPYLLRLINPNLGFLMQDLFWLTVVTCLSFWIVKPSSSATQDARRRLRVLFFGLAISILPALLMTLVTRRILHIRELDLPAWLLLSAALPLALFPTTLAYVTVVQRALDVRVLVRQGLQYALARRGVLGLQIVVSLCVVLLVAKLSGSMTFGQRIALTVGGIGAVLLTGVGSQRLAQWVDRHFFREAYNVEQVLNRLAENVTSIVELKPLLETVTTRRRGLAYNKNGRVLE
jgi:sigma-B regulation protein RsbU (phosphoserine phosphatase)